MLVLDSVMPHALKSIRTINRNNYMLEYRGVWREKRCRHLFSYGMYGCFLDRYFCSLLLAPPVITAIETEEKLRTKGKNAERRCSMRGNKMSMKGRVMMVPFSVTWRTLDTLWRSIIRTATGCPPATQLSRVLFRYHHFSSLRVLLRIQPITVMCYTRVAVWMQ